MMLPAATVLATCLASLNGCTEGSLPRPDGSGEVSVVRATEFLEGTVAQDTLAMAREIATGEEFGLITNLTTAGRYLLIGDRMISPHLAIYDLRKDELIRRFGNAGRGPGEYIDPAAFIPASAGGDEVWIYDFGTRRFTLVDIGDPEVGVEVRGIRALGATGSIEQVVRTDGGFIASGLFSGHSLLMLNDSLSPGGTIRSPTLHGEDVDNSAVGPFANRGFLAGAPSGGRVALAYQHLSRIDFFESEGLHYVTALGPRRTSPKFELSNGDRLEVSLESEGAYWIADATNDYVYALFCGCRLEAGSTPRYLHVYRWDGTFVREYDLGREVMAITVTEDNKYLYGSFMDPVPGIGEWRLPSEM